MQSIIISGSDQAGRLKKFEELVKQTIDKLKTSYDFINIEEIPSIGIETIRDLELNLVLKPLGKNKIVLIQEAQNLTTEAQNSLLKTLEEPPDYCEIYMACSDSDLLLPTIASRCLIYNISTKETIFTKEEIKENLSGFIKLLNLGFGKRLLLLDESEINKSKENAVLWLNQITLILRNELINGNEIPKTKILEILKLINKTILHLNVNTNVKLTMDNFVLSLPFTP